MDRGQEEPTFKKQLHTIKTSEAKGELQVTVAKIRKDSSQSKICFGIDQGAPV